MKISALRVLTVAMAFALALAETSDGNDLPSVTHEDDSLDIEATVQELLAWKQSEAGQKARELNFWRESNRESTFSRDELERFVASKRLVQRLSKQHPHAKFTLDTPFTILTSNEFAEYVGRGGIQTNVDETSAVPFSNSTSHFSRREEDVPASIDWTSTGCVTNAKQQGGCGSCSYFAATAAIESAFCLANQYRQLVQFSEQRSVSCFGGGCDGTWPQHVMKFVQTNGVCQESKYPYFSGSTKDSGVCDRNQCVPKMLNIEEVVRVEPREDTIKAAVAGQPVTVTMATGDAFKHYHSGIIDGCGDDPMNHAVLAVGYGEEHGVPFWKIKNSWGPTWGEGGYLRLRRGVGGHGACRITQYSAYYPRVQSPPELKGFAPYNQMVRSVANRDVCLNIPGGSQDSSVRVQMSSCNKDHWSQQLTLDRQQRLVVRSSGMCLDVDNSGSENGAHVIQFRCHDRDNQKWFYDSRGRLQPLSSPGMCLDANGRNPPSDGTSVSLWKCHGGANQKWEVGLPAFQPRNQNIRSSLRVDFCLDVAEFSYDNGARVQMYTCGGDSQPNQIFTLDDKQRLVASHSGKCLDVVGHSTSSGAHVQQFDCHDHDNQKWLFDEQGRIHPKHAEHLCLDVRHVSTDDSAEVHLFNCHADANQKWTVGS